MVIVSATPPSNDSAEPYDAHEAVLLLRRLGGVKLLPLVVDVVVIVGKRSFLLFAAVRYDLAFDLFVVVLLL